MDETEAAVERVMQATMYAMPEGVKVSHVFPTLGRLQAAIRRELRAARVRALTEAECTGKLPEGKTCLDFALWEQHRCTRCRLLAEAQKEAE